MLHIPVILIFLQLSMLKRASGYVETLAYYFPEIENDLTKVTWDHAVNSREKLDAALQGDAHMLEADVILGHTDIESKNRGDPKIPVMAHPPESVSNLTLKEFLEVFDKNGTNKGIKLDFKSRDAFAHSENIIDSLFNSYHRDYPVWLNADIFPGPVNGTKKVVDPDYFLTTCITRYPSATISVGWSTWLAPGSTEGHYTRADLDNMTDALNRNMVLMSPVTFAVRAAFASRSVDILSNLIASSSADSTTLTIWSSVDSDIVDTNGLRELINKVGKHKVYLDLPKEMTAKVFSNDSPGGSSTTLANSALVMALSIFWSLFL